MTIDPVIVTAFIGGMSAMAGFIVWLFKFVIADLKAQNAELKADRNKWIDSHMALLKAAKPLAEAVTKRATKKATTKDDEERAQPRPRNRGEGK